VDHQERAELTARLAESGIALDTQPAPAESSLMDRRHVYLLSYVYPYPNGTWAGMFIGVYSSLEQAEQAVAQLRQRPGYKDYPDGFRTDARLLDHEYDDPTFFENKPGKPSSPSPGRPPPPPLAGS
jgi:hypothetical protein